MSNKVKKAQKAKELKKEKIAFPLSIASFVIGIITFLAYFIIFSFKDYFAAGITVGVISVLGLAAGIAALCLNKKKKVFSIIGICLCTITPILLGSTFGYLIWTAINN